MHRVIAQIYFHEKKNWYGHQVQRCKMQMSNNSYTSISTLYLEARNTTKTVWRYISLEKPSKPD
jgi:hypothetical protein